MIRQRRPFAALGLGILLLVTGLALTVPPPAHADETCALQDRTDPKIKQFGPRSITLGLDAKPVAFWVDAADECGITGWSIDTPKRFLFFVYQESPNDDLVPFRNADAGITAADVRVQDGGYNTEVRRFTFQLLRQTRWLKADVRPEPVERGERITIKGTLQRADWEKKAYVGYGTRTHRAIVEFQARGSDEWVAVKKVRFTKSGRLSAQVTVKRELARDGFYRLRFAGNPSSSPSVSAPDFVEVR